MKIMAIDYGDAHTGVAISDPTGFMTGFATVINAYRPEVVAAQIAALAKEHGVEELVLGHPINMDGIHLDGCCHYGVLRNLKGTCYDDLIALNAHEGSRGPITNIVIDGLYAEGCHSAVRLLTVQNKVENIRISNVFGTYYQYCIGISKFYPGENTGCYRGITLDHIYAAKAWPARKGAFQHPPKTEKAFPLIWIQGKTVVHDLSISDLHRKETTLPKDTIYIGEKAYVKHLTIDNAVTENFTGDKMPLLRNKGHIEYLSMRRVDCGKDERLVNEGEIKALDMA